MQARPGHDVGNHISILTKWQNEALFSKAWTLATQVRVLFIAAGDHGLQRLHGHPAPALVSLHAQARTHPWHRPHIAFQLPASQTFSISLVWDDS